MGREEGEEDFGLGKWYVKVCGKKKLYLGFEKLISLVIVKEGGIRRRGIGEVGGRR